MVALQPKLCFLKILSLVLTTSIQIKLTLTKIFNQELLYLYNT